MHSDSSCFGVMWCDASLTFRRDSSSDSSVRDDADVSVTLAADVDVRDVVLRKSSRRSVVPPRFESRDRLWKTTMVARERPKNFVFQGFNPYRIWLAVLEGGW